MVNARAIEELADRIIRLFKPEKIILFGSHAYGAPSSDSDVDLLIVMPHRGPSYRVASRLRLALNIEFPIDIIVRSPAELRHRLFIRDFFIMDIVEQGIVLHEANDQRVGAEGRRRLRRRMHTAAFAKA